MWFKRFVIIVTSLHRDYLPSSWSMFSPTFVDRHIYWYDWILLCIILIVCKNTRHRPRQLKTIVKSSILKVKIKRMSKKVIYSIDDDDVILQAVKDIQKKVSTLMRYIPHSRFTVLTMHVGLEANNLAITSFIYGCTGLSLASYDVVYDD